MMKKISKNDDYLDIINLPHHVSVKHPHMSMENRAAQFAPFAALTGYDDVLEETGRLTSDKMVLAEDELEVLDRKFNRIIKEDMENTLIKITYFIKDEYKSGGKYVTKNAFIKKINKEQGNIVLEDESIVEFDDIIDLSFAQSR